jgi:hypothetical protein
MVDENKHKLFGSTARDVFRRWHKDLPKEFYALDIDMVLVEKTSHEAGGIVAVIDFKTLKTKDTLEFTEALTYKFFIDLGIPVYIVYASRTKVPNILFSPVGVFEITAVTDWKIPTWTTDNHIVFTCKADYREWEKKIRRKVYDVRR